VLAYRRDVESAAGLAALALFVLWLGYWVPYRLRHRQQLLDSRVDDRFSGGLRVLAVAGGPVGAVTPSLEPRRSVPLLVAGPSTTDAGGGERGMPEVRTGRALERRPATGATPAVRASRLAMLERRAARARRRLVLTLLLTVLTAAAWTVVGLGYVVWWAGAVPTGLLAVVLALGALAARSARRADARWAAEQRAARRDALQARALANGGPYAPRNRARVTGRAVHPSGYHTQMIPRVDVGTRASREPSPARTEKVSEAEPSSFDALLQTEEPAPKVIEQPAPGASASHGVGGPAWDPVPVPLPTYVTKPEAPRREPKPLTGATPVAAPKPSAAVAEGATPAPASGTTADVPPVSAAEAQALADELLLATEPPRQRTETLGLPLEQILARRRAAG
jgi:hypothetical protein